VVMRKLRKLTKNERIKIYKMRCLRFSFRAIARELDRNHSTIIREVRRNSPAVDENEDYYTQAQQAQDATRERRSIASKKKGRLKSEVIRHYVELHLRQAHWSPEIISGKLKILGYPISAEAIYQFIYHERPYLRTCLLVAGKSRRRRRVGKRHRKAKIPAAEKRSIEILPIEAKERKEIGHLELDAMLGKRGKSAIQNKTDRCSRKMFLDKVWSLESRPYADQLIKRVKESVQEGVLKTILQDNGAEHADHKRVDETLKVESFFCHPYCSSERGTVENRNGVLRRFFPKGTDFDDIPEEYIEWAEDYFNNLPMKVLNFQTPNQVWDEGIRAISK